MPIIDRDEITSLRKRILKALDTPETDPAKWREAVRNEVLSWLEERLPMIPRPRVHARVLQDSDTRRRFVGFSIHVKPEFMDVLVDEDTGS